jgi:hypothetical protein
MTFINEAVVLLSRYRSDNSYWNDGEKPRNSLRCSPIRLGFKLGSFRSRYWGHMIFCPFRSMCVFLSDFNTYGGPQSISLPNVCINTSLFNTYKRKRVCRITFLSKSPQYPKCSILRLFVILVGFQKENQSEWQFNDQILTEQRTHSVSITRTSVS